jgi:hypothetical protein
VQTDAEFKKFSQTHQKAKGFFTRTEQQKTSLPKQQNPTRN